jgi:hypothetical protein
MRQRSGCAHSCAGTHERPGRFRRVQQPLRVHLSGASGWGPTFGGRPTALWNPQVQTSDPTFGVTPSGFGFTITGTTNVPIVVEASTDLAGGTYLPLQTCTLTNGFLYFIDGQWTNYRARFYRIRSP